MTVRRGLLVEIITADGTSGIGEAAPHPSAPPAAVGAAANAVASVTPRLSAAPPDLDALLEIIDGVGDLPARVALETALFDLAARLHGERLAALLGPLRRERVPVNALPDEADPARSAAAACQAVAEGFACLKLKLGGQDARALVERVRAVRERVGPSVRIRLDANGAWTVAEAIDVIGRLAGHGIEYVEQPVPDLEGMAQVRQAVDVPLAADESVVGTASVEKIASARAADIVVVKPAFLGLRTALSVARAAESRGLEVVVTSALDTSIGIAAALHVAATFAGDRASGLATAALLGGDLVDVPLVPRRGELCLPDGPGLGVSLDRTALARWQLTS
jgi:o-succinylbenzoate synthase